MAAVIAEQTAAPSGTRQERRAILTHVLVFGMVALLLVGCRRGGGAGGPTLQPTASPTPRSTALPPLDPTPVVGGEDNPVRVVIAYPASVDEDDANDAAEALTTALTDAAEYAVSVTAVATQAEAVEALCNSVATASGNTVTVAWLDALGFAAADARGCGTPALIAESDDDTSTQTALYVRTDAGIEGAGALADSESDLVFCRASVTDGVTWLRPSLMLAASGVEPTRITNVRDVEDVAGVLDGFAAGECDMAGLPAGIDESDDTPDDARDAIDTLGESVAFPNAILLYPANLPLGARQPLLDAMDSLPRNAARALNTLLAAEGVVAVDGEDTVLTQYRAFLNRTGFDFAGLGS